MAPMTKPETILKQAEGLVSVGQTHAALQSFTEMFSSKRFRTTPLASLEPIMIRFVELCVEMRKGRIAKEGLMQYKNTAQNTSVGSIEVVIQKFVSMADAKLQEAQEKAERAAADAAADVDDLEAIETPESILLGAVSGDQSRDRTDRALVTPWLKFLWESYRTALETLKNNARLQVIYHQIAQQAFQFCLKHQRKVEFRRLCETLRLHLSNVAKYAHQPHAINLQDPDTLQHYLDARFAQLNTSVELELWQEAFRSVEDVHNLLIMAKKAPRPAMMANYYEKLTKIFLMSGNALYHAAAWGKFYAVTTTIGGKSDEELGRLAGQVLISALAVPVNQRAEELVEEIKGKAGRLTSLLGLSKTPTRTGLLKDALSRNVLKLASDNIRSLYAILEVTFDPLTLCTKDTAYAPYLPLLQRALLSRLISQLAQNLLALLQPLRDVLVDEQIEAYIMRGTHVGELNIRFVDDPFAGSDDTHASSSTHVRTRLGGIADALNHALAILEPSPVPSVRSTRPTLLYLSPPLMLSSHVVVSYFRSSLLGRKRRNRAVGRRSRVKRSARLSAHGQRSSSAGTRRRASSPKVSGSVDVENLNTDNLMRLQVEQLEKEKKEREGRLRVTAKRIDHVERAYRQEERPLLAKDYELQQASDRATFEQIQKGRMTLRGLGTNVIWRPRNASYGYFRSLKRARPSSWKAQHGEARKLAAEEAERLEKEALATQKREERERERAEDMERIRLRQQREEEATRRAEERRNKLAAPAAAATAAGVASAAAAAAASGPPPAHTPPRSESPAPSGGPPRLVGRGGGGWRAREQAKATGGGQGPTTATLSGTPAEDTKKVESNNNNNNNNNSKKEDGFQTTTKNVWKSSRLRGQQ
ncbi:hypothetical protein B0F90DRAFT_1767214 [Multifurca ochricompacta]|uniref:eIF3a PCI domain-containing protein n=1 Tax=Multifurca ochricompacta TaxID=376703 RepID=A0AAD4LWZ1_9AGAM|nr:hypothetical protein B0F90DRAFT_1767214 [Multifurca ochricompacta]